MSNLSHPYSGPLVGIAARLVLSAFGALLVFGLDLTVGSVTRAPFPAEAFRPETGHCRTVDLGPLRLGIPTDVEAVSALTVLEDDVDLPLAHAAHNDVRSKGEGRYSHWGDTLYLSASDNTDPGTNGRSYAVRYPLSLRSCVGLPRSGVLGQVASWLGVLLLVLPWLPITALPGGLRLRWVRAFTLPTLALMGLLAGTALLYRANGIPPGHPVFLALALGLVVAGLVYQWLAWRASRTLPAVPALARYEAAALRMALSLLVFAGVIEALARAFPAQTSFAIDPGARWFWPEYRQPRNSLGYNDREPGPKREPRVLVLGDSFTEGAGVRWGERFTSGLEAALRQADPSVEVFNAGRCGDDTLDEAVTLERTGEQVQPDVVVVAYGLNDAEGECPPSKRPLSAFARLMILRLESYAFYRAYLTRQQLDLVLRDGDIAAICREQHADDSPGWARAREGMERIARWCRERRVRPLLVVYPNFDRSAPAARDVMDRVAAAASARGFEARSALDDFGGDCARLAYSRFDSHPNREAHAIMAARLAEFVGRPEPSYRR